MTKNFRDTNDLRVMALSEEITRDKLRVAVAQEVNKFCAVSGLSLMKVAQGITRNPEDRGEWAYRLVKGTQNTSAERLQACIAFLSEHNAETAERFQRTQIAISHALFIRAGLPRESLPDAAVLAGEFACEHELFGLTLLKIASVSDGAFLADQRTEKHDGVLRASGYGLLSGEGRIEIYLTALNGYSHTYIQADDCPNLFGDEPVAEFAVSRHGFPPAYSDDPAEREEERAVHERTYRFHFVRIDERNTGSQTGALIPRGTDEEPALRALKC